MVPRKNLWPFLLLIGVCFGLFIHLFVVRQQRRRKNGKLPLFASRDQHLYRSATYSEPSQTLMDQWKTLASGSLFHSYNLGTQLAIDSVVSGEVQDIAKLQQAQTYLSGAVALDTTNNKELLHNLEVVTNLLNNAQQPSTGSSSSSSGSSAQSSPSSGNNQGEMIPASPRTHEAVGANTQGQTTNDQSLSEATKKQLEQYQQQLEKEQAQNQDFYNKQQVPSSMSDPFSIFSQFFGQDPLLDQHIGTSGSKDW